MEAADENRAEVSARGDKQAAGLRIVGREVELKRPDGCALEWGVCGWRG